MSRESLTFNVLDDVMIAASRQRVDVHTFLSAISIGDIGPLVELLLYTRSDNALGAKVESLMAQQRVACMTDALIPAKLGRGFYISNASGTKSVGFIAAGQMSSTAGAWPGFCLKARVAAGQAGLGDLEARALVGAMCEIEDNVHLHSGRSCDAILGFSSSERQFEFVVGDSGIGILNSLRCHADYSELSDAGTALQFALANGNSRFGKDSGHGLGFNSLFVALAALNGKLRFRSDDHALTIVGVSPRLVAATTYQRPRIKGFLASVICQPLQASLLH